MRCSCDVYEEIFAATRLMFLVAAFPSCDRANGYKSQVTWISLKICNYLSHTWHVIFMLNLSILGVDLSEDTGVYIYIYFKKKHQ